MWGDQPGGEMSSAGHQSLDIVTARKQRQGLDQIQSDVTLNDFIFTEDIRRACITDITYLRLKAWASAPCPFLAAIKWQ